MLPATPGASAERSSVPARPSRKRIPRSRLGPFANQGLGKFREELRRAVTAIQLYSKAHDLPEEQVLLRFDGQYGTGAVLAESFRLLLCDARQRLYRAEPNGGEAAACTCRPISSSAARKVTWCAHSTTVLMCRWGQRDNEALVVVATHPACEKKSRVGLTRVFPGLRTLLHQSAARRFHCCRCRRPLPASRGF